MGTREGVRSGKGIIPERKDDDEKKDPLYCPGGSPCRNARGAADGRKKASVAFG